MMRRHIHRLDVDKFAFSLTSSNHTASVSKLACAKRPFQISAFFLRPQGDWPSLKFHLLSDRAVVVVVAVLVAVVNLPTGATRVEGDGGQNALVVIRVPAITKTTTAKREAANLLLPAKDNMMTAKE